MSETLLIIAARQHIGVSKQDFNAGRINIGLIWTLIKFVIDRLFNISEYKKYLEHNYVRLTNPIVVYGSNTIINLERVETNNNYICCICQDDIDPYFSKFIADPRHTKYLGRFRLDHFVKKYVDYFANDINNWWHAKFVQYTKQIDPTYIVVAMREQLSLLYKRASHTNQTCLVDIGKQYIPNEYNGNQSIAVDGFESINRRETNSLIPFDMVADKLFSIISTNESIRTRDIFKAFLSKYSISVMRQIRYIVAEKYPLDIVDNILKYCGSYDNHFEPPKYIAKKDYQLL